MIDSATSKIANRIQRRVTFWHRFAASALRTPFSLGDYPELSVFCLFVGYPRSGSTLIASMLNAHPDILLGHELDVLGFVRWGAGKEQLLHGIRSSADDFWTSGSQWQGYGYRVETPWANGCRSLRVTGDKEAAMSTVRLTRDPSLLMRLREAVGVPVKVIHMVRNPLDNIATMYLRGRYPILRRPLSDCIGDFAVMARTIEELKRHLPPDELIEVRHEDVVQHPAVCLQRLCTFLDLEAEPEHVLSATRIVLPWANRSRDRLVWSAGDLRAVDEIIASSSAHGSYTGTRPARVEASSNGARRRLHHRPNFLVIGAQRCGTTLLHRLLAGHPEVYVPSHRKEVHFFDQHYERGEGWYLQHFPVDRDGLTAIGEVSPSYLSDPKAPDRILEFDRDMRLIVLLRNPVERMWSAFHHRRRVDGEARSFSEFVRDDLDALARGKYAEQLSRYHERFLREQLLVVMLEELVRDPDAELVRVQRFLALTEPWEIDRTELARKDNESFVVRYPTLYRHARGAGQLLTQRLDQGWIASRVKRSSAMSLFRRGQIVETMSPHDRSFLTAYYAADVACLGEELGLDVAGTWGFGPSRNGRRADVALLSDTHAA